MLVGGFYMNWIVSKIKGLEGIDDGSYLYNILRMISMKYCFGFDFLREFREELVVVGYVCFDC